MTLEILESIPSYHIQEIVFFKLPTCLGGFTSFSASRAGSCDEFKSARITKRLLNETLTAWGGQRIGCMVFDQTFGLEYDWKIDEGSPGIQR